MTTEIANRGPYPPDKVENHPEARIDPEDGYNWGPEDNGTMPRNVEILGKAVVGRRIVRAAVEEIRPEDFAAADEDIYWSDYGRSKGLVLTLDDGRRVVLVDGGDCCAYTSLEEFLLNPEMVDHVITGVASTEGFTKWHIFADHGDIMRLKVGWSPGNPFYYGYGFDIAVSNTIEGTVVENELPHVQRELP
ncbi:hypothetical protein KNU02_gp08 [Gordonia phage Pleakley]|uniref:DUF7448 domain-containing protein n=1 Tax=Gordonia phage Pleakley TaxID=2283246 RepID=A0A345M6C6_9CAUD|nr:hypothetical protein KNU02_gp08 [Gordonia phage Pleakley]AXH49734.1 hypothetical protein SEA_FURY_8 [Gordonia phage Fury]AXH66047.1 hypothetical protein SEA_PLEAKLEY_8 [Gordonia phage Pleakley]